MAGRLALLLAGAWLGALVLSWFVATANFRVVDRVLHPPVRPELEERLALVPPGFRREALRHLASEVNRALFRGFGLAQLAQSGSPSWASCGPWRAARGSWRG